MLKLRAWQWWETLTFDDIEYWELVMEIIDKHRKLYCIITSL